MDSIDFYYFSGTGNTLLIAQRVAEVFKRRGFNVTLKRMECANQPLIIDKEHLVGLAFPVAGSTYPFVWDFINALPDVSGTKIFMVDTFAGYSKGIVGPLKKVLMKKGYETIGAKEIIMPSNIFYICSERTNSGIIKKGLKTAEEYAEEIISGASRWGRVSFLSDFIYFCFRQIVRRMWFGGWHQRLFGFKVNKVKCTKCGVCVQSCPVRNIRMEEFPVFGAKCNFCLRCVSLCPPKAIPCKFNYKGKTYTAARPGLMEQMNISEGPISQTETFTGT